MIEVKGQTIGINVCGSLAAFERKKRRRERLDQLRAQHDAKHPRKEPVIQPMVDMEMGLKGEDRFLSVLQDRCLSSSPSRNDPSDYFMSHGRYVCQNYMVLERKTDPNFHGFNEYRYTVRCPRCGYEPLPWVNSSQEAMAMWKVQKALVK